MSNFVTKSAYELVTGWVYLKKQDKAKQNERERKHRKKFEKQR